MDQGKFIVFEGADGSGTTTISHEIVKHLREKGERVIWTREPSDGPIGKVIRDVLEKKCEHIPKALELLFRADRLYHVETLIRPVLESGCHVVCDRYYLSTIAYQSVRSTMDESITASWQLYSDMFGVSEEKNIIIQPDLWILLDADLQTMAARRRDRGDDDQCFENDEYLETVVSLYRHWMDFPTLKNRVLVDATQSIDDVLLECLSSVDAL